MKWLLRGVITNDANEQRQEMMNLQCIIFSCRLQYVDCGELQALAEKKCIVVSAMLK